MAAGRKQDSVAVSRCKSDHTQLLDLKEKRKITNKCRNLPMWWNFRLWVGRRTKRGSLHDYSIRKANLSGKRSPARRCLSTRWRIHTCWFLSKWRSRSIYVHSATNRRFSLSKLFRVSVVSLIKSADVASVTCLSITSVPMSLRHNFLMLDRNSDHLIDFRDNSSVFQRPGYQAFQSNIVIWNIV